MRLVRLAPPTRRHVGCECVISSKQGSCYGVSRSISIRLTATIRGIVSTGCMNISGGLSSPSRAIKSTLFESTEFQNIVVHRSPVPKGALMTALTKKWKTHPLPSQPELDMPHRIDDVYCCFHCRSTSLSDFPYATHDRPQRSNQTHRHIRCPPGRLDF